MCALERLQLGLAPKTQVSQGPPHLGALCLLPSHLFLFILVHQPPSFYTPTTPPHPTPTHSYPDIVSRMMFPDLHVFSLRKYPTGNQGLRK